MIFFKFNYEFTNNKCIFFNYIYSLKRLITYLKSTHVSWIAGILQTVLVALQEEFEEKPVG